jgi:hypothetical protein
MEGGGSAVLVVLLMDVCWRLWRSGIESGATEGADAVGKKGGWVGGGWRFWGCGFVWLGVADGRCTGLWQCILPISSFSPL